MAVTGYSKLQIRLHWAVFVLVAGQLIFGDAMSDAFDQGLASGAKVISAASVLHAVSGTLILALMFWRLTLRRERGVPDAPPGEPAWQKAAAKGVHHALYAVLLALPIFGALALGAGSEELGGFHGILSRVLQALVILHIVAALYGQFVQKSGVLHRMITPKH